MPSVKTLSSEKGARYKLKCNGERRRGGEKERRGGEGGGGREEGAEVRANPRAAEAGFSSHRFDTRYGCACARARTGVH